MARKPKTKAVIRKRPVKKSPAKKAAPTPETEPVVEATQPLEATLTATADVIPPKPEPSDITAFESRDEEAGMFEITGIRSTRLPNMKLRWEVPADKLEKFSKHHHVVRGRVKKI